jgi:hypothetical protein
MTTRIEPIDTDADELHAQQENSEPSELSEPQQQDDESQADVEDDESEAQEPELPSTSRKIEAEAAKTPKPPAEVVAEQPAKRGRGRPRKEQPAPAQQPQAAAAAQPEPAKPAKSAAKAKPPLPDIGATVTEKLGKKRAEQLDAVKGLLNLQASKIASLACLAVGWEPLNSEESLLVDAEFDGWQPPEEMRKVVVVGIVALPRALGDNRVRSAIGLPLLGAAGDQPAARAAEVQAEMQAAAAPPPPVVEVAPVQAQPEPQPVQPVQPEPQAAVDSYSPLFNGAAARVPKGFV